MTFEQFHNNHAESHGKVFVHGPNSASWPMLVRIYNSMAMVFPEAIDEFVDVQQGPAGIQYLVGPNPYRNKDQSKAKGSKKTSSKLAGVADSKAGDGGEAQGEQPASE